MTEYLTPFRAKLWNFGAVLITIQDITISCVMWFIIQKWRGTYQLNTGFITLFMVIFWIFHVAVIVEFVLMNIPKNEKEWGEYIESLKLDNENKVTKIKKYLMKQWKLM